MNTQVSLEFIIFIYILTIHHCTHTPILAISNLLFLRIILLVTLDEFSLFNFTKFILFYFTRKFNIYIIIYFCKTLIVYASMQTNVSLQFLVFRNIFAEYSRTLRPTFFISFNPLYNNILNTLFKIPFPYLSVLFVYYRSLLQVTIGEEKTFLGDALVET